VIVFLGLAGSGKSTQGQLLSEHLSCPWLSTGQLLRDNMKDPQLIKRMLDGEVLGDDILLPLLEAKLKQLHADHEEFILDGTPRTMVQAQWLADRIERHQIKLTGIVHLNASEEVVKQRLLRRGRPDDHEDAISERFAEYERSIKPILSYLRDQGFEVWDIDAEREPQAIAADIEQKLGVK
jgi:adenylate kinase